MNSFEILDWICDVVNPALFLIVMGMIAHNFFTESWKKGIRVLLTTAYGLFVTYGVMYVDATLGIWESLTMDYSTHSAFALVMCVITAVFFERRAIAVVVLTIYELAMLYQRYHTVEDILSTLVVVSVLFVPVAFIIKNNKLNTMKSSYQS